MAHVYKVGWAIARGLEAVPRYLDVKGTDRSVEYLEWEQGTVFLRPDTTMLHQAPTSPTEQLEIGG